MNKTGKNSTDPKIGKTIINDFKQSDIRKGLRRDYKEIKEFFLDDEH